MSAWFLLGLYRFGLLIGGLVGAFGLLGAIMYRIDKLKPDIIATRYDPLLMLEFAGMLVVLVAVAALW